MGLLSRFKKPKDSERANGAAQTDDREVEVLRIIEGVVDCISDSNFDGIRDYARIDESWGRGDPSQEAALQELASWFERQSQIWAEDNGRPLIVDLYDERDADYEADGNTATYALRAYGEELDFWLEFDFEFNEADNVVATVTLNV